MAESHALRIKRLHMRAMRRGTREMDIILSGFADARLARMGEPELDMFEALLAENDHDLYQWVSGQTDAPIRFSEMIGEIALEASKN